MLALTGAARKVSSCAPARLVEAYELVLDCDYDEHFEECCARLRFIRIAARNEFHTMRQKLIDDEVRGREDVYESYDRWTEVVWEEIRRWKDILSLPSPKRLRELALQQQQKDEQQAVFDEEQWTRIEMEDLADKGLGEILRQQVDEQRRYWFQVEGGQREILLFQHEEVKSRSTVIATEHTAMLETSVKWLEPWKRSCIEHELQASFSLWHAEWDHFPAGWFRSLTTSPKSGRRWQARGQRRVGTALVQEESRGRAKLDHIACCDALLLGTWQDEWSERYAIIEDARKQQEVWLAASASAAQMSSQLSRLMCFDEPQEKKRN